MEDDNKLKKPIIAIWNASCLIQKEGDYDVMRGDHWQTFVILPSSHILHNGVALNNQNELAFFKDSYYPDCDVTPLFRLLLRNKFGYSFKV